MKNTLFILLLFAIPLYGFSQISKIDNRYGYKSLKFDSPISQYQGNLSFIDQDASTITYSLQNSPDKNLFYVFDEEFDLIYLIFDQTSKLLVGIELKTYPKTTSSANIINVCTQNIESLVNKFERELGIYSKFSLNTIYESYGFGKITWIGSKVVLELGLDKQKGSNQGGVDFKIDNKGTFQYTHSKSVCFFKKDFYISNVHKSGF
jgi:hypothetical protein